MKAIDESSVGSVTQSDGSVTSYPGSSMHLNDDGWKSEATDANPVLTGEKNSDI